MNIIEGHFNVSDDTRVAIVVSRWNSFITERLLEGAADTLKRHGVKDDSIDVIYCPGAYELPFVARKAVEQQNYTAVIVLGCVIRGATPHFDYVCQAVNKGVSELNMNGDTPVLFGVLTTDTIQQSIERAGTKSGNKGAEAATAALEMINLSAKLSDEG